MRIKHSIVVGVVTLFAVCFIVFVAIPLIKDSFTPTPLAELPPIERLAYKTTGRTGGGWIGYDVHSIEGFTYHVSETDWKSIPIPTLIGPNLYRMPDGSYVSTVVIK